LAKLYLLTDDSLEPEGMLELYGGAMLDGLGMLQLRVKGREDAVFFRLAEELAERCRKAGVPFIVNDRPDVALLVGAAGVHLGRGDLPVAPVSRLLPPGMLVGRSVRSPSQAKEAVRDGASYVAVGPCFSTPVKPGLKPVGTPVLQETVRQCEAPVCAIGGITPSNLGRVLEARPAYVAVISAVSRSAEPLRAKELLVEALRRDDEGGR